MPWNFVLGKGAQATLQEAASLGVPPGTLMGTGLQMGEGTGRSPSILGTALPLP